jgi:diguanylate cyclase (GGDEF)-like protein
VKFFKSRVLGCVYVFLLSVLAGVANAENAEIDWLKADSGEFNLETVRQLPDSEWSRLPADETLNAGLYVGDIWVRVSVPPSSFERYLEIGYPLLDHVRLNWFSAGNSLSDFETGDRLKFDSRPIPYRNFLFPLPITSEPVTGYIQVQSEGSVQMPLKIGTAADFMTSGQVSYGWQVLFLGIMLAMALYNAFIFVLVRNPAYFWYVLTVVTSALIILNFTGLIFQWGWPDAPIMNRYFTSAIVAANILFATLFTISFLSIRRFSPISYRIMQVVACASVFGLFYGLFGSYHASALYISTLTVTVIPLIFVVGLVVWFKGQVLAKYYTIAWAPLLLGHLINTSSKIGIIPQSAFTDVAPQVGIALEVILMSFALASRINLERQRRQAAQEQTLAVQRQANQTLEARVQARTDELEQANDRLKALTITDGLTQVANRRRYDECLAAEFKRACRHRYPLSVILLDIDNFKSLNDTHGHLTGDDCLISVAKACNELINRSGDFLARYGGEEFVVLLPGTPEAGALAVAERLRQTVANAPMPEGENGKPLTLTVSVGVATAIPERDQTAASLVKRADEALYAAKGAGRNRVMVSPESDSEALGLL